MRRVDTSGRPAGLPPSLGGLPAARLACGGWPAAVPAPQRTNSWLAA